MNHEKGFWIGVAVLLIIPVVAIISTQTSILGHATLQTIAYAEAGTVIPSAVKNIEGVHSATFTLTDTIKGGMIKFEEDPLVPFSGDTYSKFVLSSEDGDKIGEIQFELKMQLKKLQEAGITPDDIRMYFNGNELRTVRVSGETGTVADNNIDDYAFYEVTAPGMGEYVIGRAKVAAVVEEPVPEVAVEENVAEVIEEEPVQPEVAPVETEEEIAEEPLTGDAVEQPEEQLPAARNFLKIWKENIFYIIALPIGLFLVIVIILVVHRFMKKKEGSLLIFDHDELREWVVREQTSGTANTDIKKILIQHTGWSPGKVDDIFPELNEQKGETSFTFP